MTVARNPFAFVTGTSSGIGEALVRELLRREWRVVGAARRAAAISDPRYTHLRLDLADLATLAATLDRDVRPLLAGAAMGRLALVNNAALEALLGPIERLDASALPAIFAVNTAAPILLMGWFQRHARAGQPLRIVNVSTGAAVTPLPGLGAYGTTKAALRMAGMILATELDAAGAKAGPDTSILSYEPGLVDTPMQTAVRDSSSEIVPIVQMFKDWAAAGALVPPALPAAEIADYLEADGHDRWEERRLTPPPTGDRPA
ncbi:MAG TPA: SDR family NAD(P)-dependent oxidoreductase [Gemmatimonadales bacterium]|nr:SDR family NAD(P)-dependent oxidoreductase [Gemmatimonadales bacterium]